MPKQPKSLLENRAFVRWLLHGIFAILFGIFLVVYFFLPEDFLTSVHGLNVLRIYVVGAMAVLYSFAILVGRRGSQAEKQATTEVRARKIIKLLAEKTAFAYGTDFLHTLTTAICTELHLDYVGISAVQGDGKTGRLLSFADNDKILPGIEYHLANTPTEYILEHDFYICESGVQKRYPLDRELIMFEANGYIGVSLKSSKGNSIGVLVGISKKEIKEPNLIESVFHILGARVQAELERQNMESEREATLRLKKQMEDNAVKTSQLEVLGKFAGGIAHDFNNILVTIIGNLELAKLKLKETETDANRSIENAYKGAWRARELTRQILNFSGQQEPIRSKVSIRALFGEVKGMLDVTLSPNHQIVVEEGEDCFCNADATMIHQVLMNLTQNAMHAMKEKGEVRLAVRKVNPSELQFHRLKRASGASEFIEITVTDNGSGMPEEIKAKIFEPFFTTKKKGHGTGLGLSVVHGIIERHEGLIEVESKVGVGTKFSILLPIFVASDTRTFVRSMQDPISSKVMVVDDESAIADSLAAILTAKGFDAVAFSNPLQALDEMRVNGCSYWLLITDISMPEMTGDELARHVRMAYKEKPIILTSGVAKALDNIANLSKPWVTIEKPYDIAKLMEQIVQYKKLSEQESAARVA